MNIQKVIKNKGFTIAQVATKMKNQRGGIGISQGALSTALNGNPTIDKLKEIADIIGVSLSELVADSDNTLVALVKSGDDFYSANTLDGLKEIVNTIEKKNRDNFL